MTRTCVGQEMSWSRGTEQQTQGTCIYVTQLTQLARTQRRPRRTKVWIDIHLPLWESRAYVFQPRLRMFGLDTLALHYQYGFSPDRPRIRTLLRGSQYGLSYNERVILHPPHLPCRERLTTSVRRAEKIL